MSLVRKFLPSTTARRILIQIIKEFRLQFAISMLWAIYSFYSTHQKDTVALIGQFSKCFFFTSWMAGQLLRIMKQQKIEDDFQHVKNELEKLLGEISRQTKHLMGYTIGADGIGYCSPYFSPYVSQNMSLGFSLFNDTDFPIFDISAEWVDLDEQIMPEKGILHTRNRLVIGTIYAHKAIMHLFGFDMNQRQSLAINIFIQTRTHDITQQVRVRKLEGNLKIAYKVTSTNFNKTQIPDDFPQYDPQHPENVFK